MMLGSAAPIGMAFEAMARRLETLPDAEFAGAVVIMPPGGGEPIAFVTADPKPDLMQFWSAVRARVEIRATEAMQAANQQDPWSGRR